MKHPKQYRAWLFVTAILAGGLAGCGGSSTGQAGGDGGISPQVMADALHAIIEADRTVYAEQVVNRLQDEQQVILASEHWQDDRALPLPAQMFRMGAELAGEMTDAFSYALLSEWPINSNNAPRTPMESEGLKIVVTDQSTPFYGTESLGGVDYYTAVYADVAVSQACINCHNNHRDSPRTDFELGETMGGIVIRIPLN